MDWGIAPFLRRRDTFGKVSGMAKINYSFYENIQRRGNDSSGVRKSWQTPEAPMPSTSTHGKCGSRSTGLKPMTNGLFLFSGPTMNVTLAPQVFHVSLPPELKGVNGTVSSAYVSIAMETMGQGLRGSSPPSSS